MRGTAKQPDQKLESVVFIYQVKGQPDFWVFDGVQYCRFALTGGRFHLVRVQSYLPAGAIGFGAALTAKEHRALASEAARRNIRLAFYSSVEACEREACIERHQQYIFDRLPPAGALTVNGISFLKD